MIKQSVIVCLKNLTLCGIYIRNVPDNKLYYGDNLRILRDYIKDESVDLIYLDPPFNSKRDYNILFKEPTGKQSRAQITAFEDTWHWTEEAEKTFQEIVDTAPPALVEMMVAFRRFVGINDVMAYLTMMAIRLIELRRVLKSTGSIYLHCDPTASHYLKVLLDTIFGKKNFRNEIAWCYRKWSITQRQFVRNHDIILFYSKSAKNEFNTLFIPVSAGTIKRWKGQKQQAIFDEGVRKATSLENEIAQTPMPDWWPMSIINPAAKERLGYQTQKPEMLLERIIMASSNGGDVVLDPFCGCGTTIAVSERLKRQWIGIDITHLAINLIKLRLQDSYGLQPKKDYEVIGEPEDLTGAIELASQNRYQFQWWALSLIQARPHQDKKKGSDAGIDGLVYFEDEKDKIRKAIVQVKSGHVSVTQIRDLGHVMDREGAEIGIFITLENPTKPMLAEAVQKGFYKSVAGVQYPKIQIKTIEELLRDNRLNIPTRHISHKKAEPSGGTASQMKMDI